MLFLDHIYLIPLLPAVGAAIMLLFGRKLQKQTVSAVCVGAVALTFIFACGAFWEYTHSALATNHQPFEKVMYTWLGIRYRPPELRPGEWRSGGVPGRGRIPARSSVCDLAALRDRRGYADSHLLDRIHGA